MDTYFEALEFDKIIEKLKDCALSEQARERLGALTPYMDEALCQRKMEDTTAARLVLDGCGSPPLPSMKGLCELLSLSEKGAMLLPEQLMCAARFAQACRQTASYLKRGESLDSRIAVYGRGIENLGALREEIESSVNEDRVYDEASPALKDIRRKIAHLEAQIREKLAHVLQSRKQYLADSYITNRNGHFVLPVQRRYQNQFGGTVIEVSGKGSTVFMEPACISAVQGELSMLSIEEDGEVRRILYTLTARVLEEADAIRRNMELMEELDVLFAKAKLSAAMKARAVEIGADRSLNIVQGRHPLLKEDECVPLDFKLEKGVSGVIITGPNTGGKTVALKTVGLLTMMAQCALHIPCGEGTVIAMRDAFLCDIGDSQNISQSLSTFSGHITRVIRILESAGRDSLVLLDELGSGTDPAEGMGIAVAVLEELRRLGCCFVVTTHYPQVKTYAQSTEGVQSARMAFDPETLRPLYRLEMGRSGESCALLIARRLGLAPHILARAQREVYGTETEREGEPSAAPRQSRLKRIQPKKETADPSGKFSMGDSVLLLPENETGIVYRPANENGDVVVQIKGEKFLVKHTRLRLQLPAAELYPPDYDFSVIFDTVQARKARHSMGKHNDPTVCVLQEEENYKRR